MIESLRKLRKAYGQGFAIPSPVDAEGMVSLDDMARGFASRLISLFTRNAEGKRSVYGDQRLWQDDPQWCNYPSSTSISTATTAGGLVPPTRQDGPG